MKKNVLSVLLVMLSVASSLEANQVVSVNHYESIIISAENVKSAAIFAYAKRIEAKYSEELIFLDRKVRDAIIKYDGENYPRLNLVNFDTDAFNLESRYDFISFNNIVDTMLVKTEDQKDLDQTELYTYLELRGYTIFEKSVKIVKKSDSDKVQEELKKFDGFNCNKGNNFRIVEPAADKHLINFKQAYTDSEYQVELVKIKESVCSPYSFTMRSTRASYNQIIVEDSEYENFIKLNKGLKTLTYVQIILP